MSTALRLLVFAISLAWTTCASATETLQREDLPGNWASVQPTTFKGRFYQWLFPRSPMTLEISPEFDVTFTRLEEDENLVSEASLTDIMFADETIMISLNDGHKLIVSGWTNAGTKMLFGQLLIRYEGTVVNGIPVSFSANP